MAHSETFHEDRAKCIGGSDVAHLLDMDPWGCERLLWYSKRGVPEDFPFVENAQMLRGVKIEEIAIDQFCFTHGYRATTPGPPAHLTHPQYPMFGAHVDRFVTRIGSLDETVLENKIPNLRNFMVVKGQGPSDIVKAQTMWNMFVSRLQFGVISVFNADRFESLKFDVRANRDMESQFITIGTRFWDQVQINPDNPFPQKPEGDARCFKCQWRKTCKGLGRTAAVLTEEETIDVSARLWSEDDSVEPAIKKYLEARDVRKDAEDNEKDAKEELDRALDGRSVVTSSGFRAYWQTTVKNFKAQPAKEAEQRKQRSLKVIDPG